MSAHGAVIPPASPRERLKDRGFRALLMFCTVAGVGMLGLLLYDVVSDGGGKLSWDFVTTMPSSFPDQAGIESALMGTIWLMVVCGAFIVPDCPRLLYVLIDLCQPTSVCILRARVEQLAGVPRDRGSQRQPDAPARAGVALADNQVHDMELAAGIGKKTAEVTQTL